MFTVELGKRVKSRVTGLTGIVTARSENLYGCNRYYIQPMAGKDAKVPDGWWIDEDDAQVIGNGVIVSASKKSRPKDNGGPMSRVC